MFTNRITFLREVVIWLAQSLFWTGLFIIVSGVILFKNVDLNVFRYVGF